ncbi:hypothetical protein [Mesorhizobium sp. CAU 1741]|uniref:hypothetical protein n=1 Tax=Mesorhizobium sp. CAU 1741 TaxID=3140366 RepID=UPI00325B1469
MKDIPFLSAIAASDLVSASVLASMIGMLGAKGILSDEEVREVYVQALHLLDQQQDDDHAASEICAAAREIIESQLR